TPRFSRWRQYKILSLRRCIPPIPFTTRSLFRLIESIPTPTCRTGMSRCRSSSVQMCSMLDTLPARARIRMQDYGANSNYNSLQVHFERRLSKGLSFSAAYTWSHQLDTVANEIN